MARQIVVLALIFFAIVGIASATPQAPIPPQSDAGIEPAPDNNVIGTVDGSGGEDDAAPVGAPVSPGTFSPVSPAEAPNGSGSTILEASTVAGLVVSAFVGSFLF